MKKRDFKEALFQLLDISIEDMTFCEKMVFVEKLMIEYQRTNEDKRDTSMKGKKWTDEELKIILSDASSESNCLKYAKLFKRGYGSIEQIYRWSTTPITIMSDERKEDSFIIQIKKVSRELGLRG
ncbi:MAG: hypothetical protein BWX78_01122 [Firmicutes bacterium ADurb.Bin099]|nr:MAG: hypothetical protein BWX78_01122 [Firmicutes bacterium ADurb.Bin099]